MEENRVIMVPSLIGEAQKAALTKPLPWRNLYLNLCKQISVKIRIEVSTGEGIGGISRPSVCTIPRGHFLEHYIVNGSPCSAVYFFVVGQIRGLQFWWQRSRDDQQREFHVQGNGDMWDHGTLGTWNYFIMTKIKDELGWLRVIAKRWA